MVYIEFAKNLQMGVNPIVNLLLGAVPKSALDKKGVCMGTAIKKTVDIFSLRAMLDKANNVSEIKALNSLIPELTEEEKIIARKNMDSGIYDAKGTLIGEYSD